MTITYLFTISFCVVFGMIFLKVFENRRKKLTKLSALLSSYDEKTLDYLQGLTERTEDFSLKAQVIYREKLPQQTKYFLLLVMKGIMEKYQSLQLSSRGNRNLRTGDASAFLKDIAKHKRENGGGRIEDNVIE
jgi:hypothetical protein